MSENRSSIASRAGGNQTHRVPVREYELTDGDVAATRPTAPRPRRLAECRLDQSRVQTGLRVELRGKWQESILLDRIPGIKFS